MIRKVRNCCETCENLVCVATTIGQLQHTEYLKPTFLDTFKWAIRPVFPETVTYVNDIPDVVKSPILLFAVDTKIVRRIKYSHEDYTQLQLDLDCFSKWSLRWKLKFNVSKCVMSYTSELFNNTLITFVALPSSAICQRPWSCD